MLEIAPLPDRPRFIEYCADRAPLGGCWVECGVAAGESARLLLRHDPPKLWLCDSWQGLPVEWDIGSEIIPAGKFACDRPVFHDPRVSSLTGMFADTLPGWTEPIALLHIDCDLYASAATVLESLGPCLIPSAIVILDEAHGFGTWADGEYRAWVEWVERPWRWIARNERWRAAIVIE